MKKIIDKTVNLNVVNPNVNVFMLVGLFKGQAKQEGWTDEEINKVIDHANSGDYKYLVATIKNHCEAKNHRPDINPLELGNLLSQLGLFNHYLGTKEIALWDDYDYNQYTSLQMKASKTKF